MSGGPSCGGSCLLKPGNSCAICQGPVRPAKAAGYIECAQCAHQSYDGPPATGPMVNENLDLAQLERPNGLDRFQLDTTLASAQGRTSLLDVGAGSGRFLRNASPQFQQSFGVEVSPSCIEFCTQTLGLKVSPAPPSVESAFDVITFWHSLEHIPIEAIEKMFQTLAPNIQPQTKLVVSVPNVDSLQFKLFKTNWPYFDPPFHLHQFSRESLEKLMAKKGFVTERYFHGAAYSVFGFLQGFMNFLSPFHNYFYFRKKRAWTFGLSRGRLFLLDLYNALLIAIFLAPAVLLSLWERSRPENNGVITLCLRPEPRLNS